MNFAAAHNAIEAAANAPNNEDAPLSGPQRARIAEFAGRARRFCTNRGIPTYSPFVEPFEGTYSLPSDLMSLIQDTGLRRGWLVWSYMVMEQHALWLFVSDELNEQERAETNVYLPLFECLVDGLLIFGHHGDLFVNDTALLMSNKGFGSPSATARASKVWRTSFQDRDRLGGAPY